MPELLPKDDYQRLELIERLFGQGSSLTEIARVFDVVPSTITYWLNRRGLRTRTRVEGAGGASFSELVERGEYVVEEEAAAEPEHAEVAA